MKRREAEWEAEWVSWQQTACVKAQGPKGAQDPKGGLRVGSRSQVSQDREGLGLLEGLSSKLSSKPWDVIERG